jgi:hypothetical protein
LLIAKAKAGAPRGPKYAPDDASRAAQAAHLARLKAFHRHPGSEFGSPDELANQIAYTTILDLLVADYAQKEVRERDVAEGFIREMAKRVAGDKALDLDGMKQALCATPSKSTRRRSLDGQFRRTWTRSSAAR